MPDRKNKVRIGFPDQKNIKKVVSYIIGPTGAILWVSPQNAGPLEAPLFTPSKNQNSMASNRRNSAKFNSQMTVPVHAVNRVPVHGTTIYYQRYRI